VDLLEQHVRELGRRLHGPRGAREDLLREVHDHLRDTAEAGERRGLSRREAASEAVASFGTVEQLAPGYQTVLSVGMSRRMSLLLLVTLIAQPAAWGIWEAAQPKEATGAAHVLNVALETVGTVAMVLALGCALVCGVGVRWLGVRAGVTRAVCLSGAAASGAIMVLAVSLFLTDGSAEPFAVAYLTAVCLAPFTHVLLQARRCLRSLSLSGARA
jgi:hypothetical protein